jgi:hypothetical protein
MPGPIWIEAFGQRALKRKQLERRQVQGVADFARQSAGER